MALGQRFVFIAVALAAAGGVGHAQPPPTKVVVAQAKQMDVPSTVTLVGTVRAARSSRVASELAGIVAEMPVREGDRVEQGAAICQLDSVSLSLQRDQAQARLSSLQSRHEELVAGTRKEEIARQKALLEESAAEWERWRFERDRVERLYAGSESNAKEISDVRASHLAAEQRKNAAQAAYDQAVAGPRREAIAQAGFEVAEQQAVVSRLESDLRKEVIRAPFSGHVVARLVEVGEWVPAGGHVVTMIDLNTVLVWVDAPESALPYLIVGAPARTKIDALDRSFDGVIKHVMREADPTARTFPVEIELDNGDGLLAAGMFARATVPAGHSRTAVAVPKDAIVTSEGIDRVGLVLPTGEATSAMLVPVTVGASAGDWIAISSGNIGEGSVVVVRGTESLMPFPAPVIVVDEQGTPVATRSAPTAPSAAPEAANKEN